MSGRAAANRRRRRGLLGGAGRVQLTKGEIVLVEEKTGALKSVKGKHPVCEEKGE